MSTSGPLVRRAAGVATALSVLGCAADIDTPPLGEFHAKAEPFIAMAGDFEGFEGWRHVDLPDAVSGHAAVQRRTWLNVPAHKAHSWPIGTIAVKTGDQSNRWLALVKRGGGYNSDGLKGWDFFELTRNTRGEMVIYWRGVGPPAGEEYGAAGQTCNTCHGLAASDGLFSW